MKNGKRTKNKQGIDGITLIALVITIIVLLILVGVSIATLTGENGILSKANKVKEETEKANAKEKVQLAVMASYGNDGRLDYNELKENLDNVEGITNVPNSITKESFELEVNVDGYKVTIEENGNVTIEGEKTGTVPTPPKPTTIEQAKEQGKVLDENNPVTIKDKYDNKIVIPEGFKIASDSAEDVTGGVVIEDGSNSETLGSQFVWIPIGEIKGADGVTKTIELNRYTFSTDGTPTAQGELIGTSSSSFEVDGCYMDYFQELVTSLDLGNTIAKDIEAFKTSVTKNGGYYIARYEAGDASATTDRTDSSTKTTIPVCKQGQYVYNYITQPQAAILSRDMYKNKSFTSDLINSYAWDTAIVFIQEFSGDGDYSIQVRLQTTLAETGEATDGTNKDVRCNIYDMAGNVMEWTTETFIEEKDFNSEDISYYSRYPCMVRGATYNNTNCTCTRPNGDRSDVSEMHASFRPLLYL